MSTERIVELDEIREDEVGGLLDAWRVSSPAMGILALVPEAEREKAVAVLQDQCGRRAVPLRGAVFPALVSRGRFESRGLVLLRLDTMPFSRIYSPLTPRHPERAAVVERMCQDVVDGLERPRETSLFVVFDALLPDVATVLDALYLKLADGVRYLGVNAGSETFRPIPCLFDNEREVQDGALLLMLPGSPGAVVEHCYQAPELMVSATSTEGNRIITIDWRPAFEVYQEAIREEYGTEVDRESFYRYGAHFPFGIVRATGEILVRIPVALESDGSLFCVGEVPANALLTLLRAPAVDSSLTVERLTQGLAGLGAGPAAAELLTFYCAGRRIHLGDMAEAELLALGTRTGARRITGALSLGEIGHSMQWGYPLFHNGAIVCCPWGPG